MLPLMSLFLYNFLDHFSLTSYHPALPSGSQNRHISHLSDTLRHSNTKQWVHWDNRPWNLSLWVQHSFFSLLILTSLSLLLLFFVRVFLKKLVTPTHCPSQPVLLLYPTSLFHFRVAQNSYLWSPSLLHVTQAISVSFGLETDLVT